MTREEVALYDAIQHYKELYKSSENEYYQETAVALGNALSCVQKYNRLHELLFPDK